MTTHRRPKPTTPPPDPNMTVWEANPEYADLLYTPGTPVPPKRRHIFRWVFLAVQLIFLAWAVSGAASGAHNTSSAQTAGTTIAVMVIIFLWAAVDVILGVGWLIFRRRG